MSKSNNNRRPVTVQQCSISESTLIFNKMKFILALILFSIIFSGTPVLAATVSCEVQAVRGDVIILKNCNEKRAEGFRPGDKVKIKLQKPKR